MEIDQYLWCRRCSHLTYGTRCGKCSAAVGVVERIGPGWADVERWARSERLSQRVDKSQSDACAGCGQPIRKHRRERHLGGDAPDGVHTRFGTLTLYSQPPRPGDQGRSVAVCDCPPNQKYREKYGKG